MEVKLVALSSSPSHFPYAVSPPHSEDGLSRSRPLPGELSSAKLDGRLTIVGGH